MIERTQSFMSEDECGEMVHVRVEAGEGFVHKVVEKLGVASQDSR